ncbi:hypothetical protein GCM10022255_044670 [Dactylosporangium darangshiense]|uniref:Uncharacterized protein n=1 Tax=Dactylosporangium darangshiense TaxID=579108 RepID=A0ABP8DAV8_9ACTN
MPAREDMPATLKRSPRKAQETRRPMPAVRGRPATTRAPAASPQVLREYAFLGDGRRGALVGPRGEVALLWTER